MQLRLQELDELINRAMPFQIIIKRIINNLKAKIGLIKTPEKQIVSNLNSSGNVPLATINHNKRRL
jgi:hypothetical protein